MLCPLHERHVCRQGSARGTGLLPSLFQLHARKIIEHDDESVFQDCDLLREKHGQIGKGFGRGAFADICQELGRNFNFDSIMHDEYLREQGSKDVSALWSSIPRCLQLISFGRPMWKLLAVGFARRKSHISSPARSYFSLNPI